ncbi:hypothetical protein JOB18_045624 [Solea senegalensis]|uniref:Uncharacterized protein n=1 Tax=Solea senegalensis TaxID=28829 RepID=A0AAV6R9X6_SOLSE|nr:hypothetical protein JOB18_045624 [Solea senegalensis]
MGTNLAGKQNTPHTQTHTHTLPLSVHSQLSRPGRLCLSVCLSLSIMSSLSFLSLYGASVILLLLTTASQSQDYDFPTPGYDDNTSLSVSFFSNTSFEELEKLSERFIDAEEEDEDFLYGDGWTEEQEVTVTTATTRGTTESGVVDGRNAASLPVSLEISTLVWILMMVISVNLQQLQHTL